jgi:hypothetical protein
MMLNSQGYQVMCGGNVSPVNARMGQVMQLCALFPDNITHFLMDLTYSELATFAKDCHGSR